MGAFDGYVRPSRSYGGDVSDMNDPPPRKRTAKPRLVRHKPCPFCGHAPTVFLDALNGMFACGCPGGCAVSPVTSQRETEAEAWEAWDYRAKPKVKP